MPKPENQKLKVTLIPRYSYYFGGENSFNEGTKENRNRRSTYLLKSMKFPQQTGVLGLIRNQLLLQNDLLKNNSSRIDPKNRPKAKALIGAKGFRYVENATKTSASPFGVIDALSPVYLISEDDVICGVAPLDDFKVPDPKIEDVKTSMVLKKVAGNLSGKEGGYYLSDYSEKNRTYQQIQQYKSTTIESEKLCTTNYAADDLFLEDKRVGITKAVRPWEKEGVEENENESGFYYQVFKRFQSANSLKQAGKKKAALPEFFLKGFCFFVDLKDVEEDGISWTWDDRSSNINSNQCRFTLQSTKVEFGGERCVFDMLVKPVDAIEDYQATWNYTTVEDPSNIKAMVCISPCYINDVDGLESKSLLRITDSISFRFLKTSIDTEDYIGLQKGETDNGKNNTANKSKPVVKKITESTRFFLLDRGSVIYYHKDDESELKKIFKNEQFERIGYNKIHTI